jgi:trk system potassium uptake protein TrkH
LVVLGGLGFLVLNELIGWTRSRGQQRLGLHTKIVLTTSGVLRVLGAALFFLLERSNPRTLAPLAWHEALLPSLFHSVSARTAGFNTLEVGRFSSPALLLLIVLMFVGGSPASCAGGVKTTSAFVLFSVAWARLRTRRNGAAFGREIGHESVTRAATLVLLAWLFVTLACAAVLLAEAGLLAGCCQGGPFLDMLFEVTSAFGTVGLSTGVTPRLAAAGKLVLVVVMYVGRVGPLSLFAALVQPPATDRVRLPDELVVIG